MGAVKSVEQNNHASPEILGLLQDFRMMVNDCIRMGLEENITSMKKLSSACYYQLKKYDMPTSYRLTAISKTAGILRNYRKKKKENPSTKEPFAKKLILVDCYNFKIFGRLLRLTYRRGEYVFVVLNDHTLKMLPNHSARSITLTPEALSICYSNEVEPVSLEGLIGIDNNLDNLTLADSNGCINRYDLSRATRVRAMCREVKRHFTRNDARIRKSVFGKYGRIQRNRVVQLLNRVSRRIVDDAKKNKFGLVMEDLTGLRKLYRKGNGQGKNYRAILNSWYYRELQRQIEYKAQWEGLPVKYVGAWGTSSKCSICGGRTRQSPNGHRLLRCTECHREYDRDWNAARNILYKGGLEMGISMRFKPDGSPVEAHGTIQEPKGLW